MLSVAPLFGATSWWRRKEGKGGIALLVIWRFITYQQDGKVSEVVTLAHCLFFRLIHQDTPSCGPVTKTTCTGDLT